MRRLLLATVTACWTGAAPAPAPAPAPTPGTAPHKRLEISLERTMCFGNCPVYKLEIHDDGRFEWTGEKYVQVMGTHAGVLSGDDLAAIDSAITRGQFFQRDRYGQLQEGPTCTRSGNTTSCSWKGVVICSDTSHTVLTIRRGSRTHTVDNGHCGDEDGPLNAIEEVIVERTRILDWIGR